MVAVGVSCVGYGLGDFVFCFHDSFVLMFFIYGEMGVWDIFGLASETRENGGFLADNIKGHALTDVPFLARLPFR